MRHSAISIKTLSQQAIAKLPFVLKQILVETFSKGSELHFLVHDPAKLAYFHMKGCPPGLVLDCFKATRKWKIRVRVTRNSLRCFYLPGPEVLSLVHEHWQKNRRQRSNSVLFPD